MTYTLGMAARATPVQDVTRSGNGSVTQDATPSEQGEVTSFQPLRSTDQEIALRHARLEAEIAGSLHVNALLSEQLHEARIDRERWRGQAQQLVAAALAAPITESGIRSRRLGFAARLMGLV